jgi:hypothetical protein
LESPFVSQVKYFFADVVESEVIGFSVDHFIDGLLLNHFGQIGWMMRGLDEFLVSLGNLWTEAA